MPAPIPTGGAVFLGYPREDAVPARRIADAVCGFGVETQFGHDTTSRPESVPSEGRQR